MNDVMLTKLSEAQVFAFVDELEKIAAAGGLSDVELALLKEAFGLNDIRQGITSGATALGKGLENRGLLGGAKLVNALKQPIETGAAGKALQAAGQHFTDTAGKGILGGASHGLGQVLQHHGADLAGGGAKAIGSAAWKVMNPVGNVAHAALTSGGHMASRAANLDPAGMAHKALTHYIPEAGHIAGAAGAGAIAGVPMGAAGLIGHGVLGSAAHAAPMAAELAHHAIGGLGEAGADLAHHVGADVVGAHGHGVMQKLRSYLPGAAKATQAAATAAPAMAAH